MKQPKCIVAVVAVFRRSLKCCWCESRLLYSLCILYINWINKMCLILELLLQATRHNLHNTHIIYIYVCVLFSSKKKNSRLWLGFIRKTFNLQYFENFAGKIDWTILYVCVSHLEMSSCNMKSFYPFHWKLYIFEKQSFGYLLFSLFQKWNVNWNHQFHWQYLNNINNNNWWIFQENFILEIEFHSYFNGLFNVSYNFRGKFMNRSY